MRIRLTVLSGMLAAVVVFSRAMAWLDPAAAHLASASAPVFERFNPALTVASAHRLGPVVAAVERHLDAVDARLLASRAHDLRHTISGLYGSAFLRHNLVGNDQDYFALVHLGEVDLSQGQLELAAREILARVESYRQAGEAVVASESSPELAVVRYLEALPRTRLEREAAVVRELAQSLGHVLRDEPYLVSVPFRGQLKVSAMDAGEGYLPIEPTSKFLSNVVDHAEGVFWGVRAVSLQLYFCVDVRAKWNGRDVSVRRVQLSPLAPPKVVSKLWQHGFTGVFVTSAGAAEFERTAFAGARGAQRRLEYALGYLSSLSLEAETRVYPIKFVKRLHALLDAMGPALPEGEVMALRADIERELHSKVATRADQIKTFGETLHLLAEHPTLLSTYVETGDVDRMLDFVAAAEEDFAQLESREARDAAAQLKELVHEIRVVRVVDGESLAACLAQRAPRIEALGMTLVRKLGWSQERMVTLTKRMRAAFEALGFRPARVLADADGTLAVHPEDLRCGSDELGLLSALRAKDARLDVGSWRDAGFSFVPSALRRADRLLVREATRPSVVEPGPSGASLKPHFEYARCAAPDSASEQRWTQVLAALSREGVELTRLRSRAHR